MNSQKRLTVPTNSMETNDKIIIYQTEDGQTQIDVRLENENKKQQSRNT